jgi:hypothetical protein
MNPYLLLPGEEKECNNKIQLLLLLNVPQLGYTIAFCYKIVIYVIMESLNLKGAFK